MTNVLVCIKRVPEASSQVLLSDDLLSVDARHVGYTVSPQEECAVELAIQIAKSTGGAATALSLGPSAALEQLRDALAVGCTGAILIEGDADRFGPIDVAASIADVVSARAANGQSFELILVGNDAADTGDFQVGVRLGYALGRPVLTGISTIEVSDGSLVARGDGPEGTEVFELPLPAVVAVQEGGITPRYPSIPGRMKAKRTPVDVLSPAREPAGSGRVGLRLPPAQPSAVEILGEGASAAPALVDLLVRVGVVTR